MKVVVCIKQVPDTKGGVEFNPDGTLNRAAMLAIMNPDDKAGLEAALRLKDQYGAEVTVVTMGLPKAEDVLREALAMGADNANEPRYMTPGGIFEACAKEITVWGRKDLKDVEDSNLGLKGSPTQIAKASDKVRKGKGETVNLDVAESVDYIMNKLQEKHII